VAQQKIRIRLKGYDHQQVDKSAKDIVDTAQRTGATITGHVELPEGTEMCMPGDNTLMTVQLIHPIAMDEGLRFAIREGGRTVGAGVVTKIIE